MCQASLSLCLQGSTKVPLVKHKYHLRAHPLVAAAHPDVPRAQLVLPGRGLPHIAHSFKAFTIISQKAQLPNARTLFVVILIY